MREGEENCISIISKAQLLFSKNNIRKCACSIQYLGHDSSPRGFTSASESLCVSVPQDIVYIIQMNAACTSLMSLNM